MARTIEVWASEPLNGLSRLARSRKVYILEAPIWVYISRSSRRAWISALTGKFSYILPNIEGWSFATPRTARSDDFSDSYLSLLLTVTLPAWTFPALA
jgi:hypothetical protein